MENEDNQDQKTMAQITHKPLKCQIPQEKTAAIASTITGVPREDVEASAQECRSLSRRGKSQGKPYSDPSSIQR